VLNILLAAACPTGFWCSADLTLKKRRKRSA
jgi:hypothetical protein